MCRVLQCGSGLVPALAQRNEPVGAGSCQVRFAVISGVGQNCADHMIGVPCDGVYPGLIASGFQGCNVHPGLSGEWRREYV